MLLDTQELRTERSGSAISVRERALPVPDQDAARSRLWRAAAAGPLIAAVTFLAAIIAADAAGIPIRDPDHVAGRRLLGVFWMVGLLIVLDIVIRAARRAQGWLPTVGDVAFVWRERWTLRRGIAVGAALLSFYATYLAYRNLKSFIPLLRPGDLFDPQLQTARPRDLRRARPRRAACTRSSARARSPPRPSPRCTCSSSPSSRRRWHSRSSSRRTFRPGSSTPPRSR